MTDCGYKGCHKPSDSRWKGFCRICYRRQKREALKAKGICPSCESRKLDTDRKTCSHCLGKAKTHRENAKLNNTCKQNGCKNKAKEGKFTCEAHLEYRSNRYKTLRKAAIKKYGERCACCGESHEHFLAIDHIAEDGAERRKNEHGHGENFFSWLKKNNYPEGFQALCHNCNYSKYLNGGICAHKYMSSTEGLKENEGVPGKQYQTVLIDPPWSYQNFGAKKHGAAKGHYEGMTLAEMGALKIKKFLRKDATVFIWATWPKLHEAMELVKVWGLEHVTSAPWVKTTPRKESISFGIGFWFYQCSEVLLVCRNGKPPGPKQGYKDKMIGLMGSELMEGRAQFYAPKGPHSRKPPSLVEWIESRFSGPYLELFARNNRPGWDSIGLEIGTLLIPEGFVSVERAKEIGLLVDEEEMKELGHGGF